MNIFSPVSAHTGYGLVGYNIWKHIYNHSPEKTTLFLQGQGSFEQNWDISALKQSIDNRIHFNKDAPCFKLWHGNDLFTRTIGNSKYGVLSFFEIDKLTPIEKVSYNSADIIMMPSLWAKNVLENNGVTKPIVVIPQGVDTTIFNGLVSPPDKETRNTFVFLNVGKWEVRKGHDILVDMFNNAFNEEDDVELWMINHNPFLNNEQTKQWGELYSSSKLGSKIRFFPRLPDQATLSKVMSYADCGIFPSRGEGWNNEALEMMAMNKPVIITNYSAHTQFCNKDNSYLIDIQETESAFDNMWFHGEGNWATIGPDQIDQSIEHMRYVYKNNIRTNPSGLQTAQDHSWTKTANSIISTMYS